MRGVRLFGPKQYLEDTPLVSNYTQSAKLMRDIGLPSMVGVVPSRVGVVPSSAPTSCATLGELSPTAFGMHAGRIGADTWFQQITKALDDLIVLQRLLLPLLTPTPNPRQ